MAKLNGVKTLDMVGGEITKIAYDGAEYAKVDDSRAGDICEVRKAWGTIEEGGFYVITKITESYGKTYTHIGEGVNYYTHGFNYFRKIDAKPTQVTEDITARVGKLEERVTALEGAPAKPQYKTEKRRAKVGERILITGKNAGSMRDMTVGKSYEVVLVGTYGDYVNVIDDKGAEASAYDCKYEVIVEAADTTAETITHNGATYELVSRKAQPGDVVYVTPEADSTGEIPNGTYYSVNEDGKIGGRYSGDYDVYRDWHNRTESTVLVYAPKQQPKPKAGDIVVITANTNGSRNAVGDIGKVGKLRTSYASVDVPGKPESSSDSGNWTEFDEMRLATPAEVAEYEKAVAKAKAPAKLDEGDYGVITGKGDRGEFNSHQFAIGEVVKVETRSSSYGDRVRAQSLDGSDYWWVYDGYIRKATDAEVAAAKAPATPKLKVGDYVKALTKSKFESIDAGAIVKVDEIRAGGSVLVIPIGDVEADGIYQPHELELLDARATVFAKIGRKPNEFKKGDIVRSKEPHTFGKVGEITDGPRGKLSGGNYTIKGIGVVLGHDIELIAPVESRADKPAGADAK